VVTSRFGSSLSRQETRLCRRLLRTDPLDDEVVEIFRNALLGGAPAVADRDIE
jgi:hypothetical protein